MSVSNVSQKALHLLKGLPRVNLGNIRDNPGSKKDTKRGRAQHGGDKHGAGNKGSGQRQNYMRLGYETGNHPFYLRFSYENYYKGHHLRRQYPPITMHQLQTLIDTNRIDTSRPIDLCSIMGTGLFNLHPDQHHFGFNLTSEGADNFKAKINIEVQYTDDLSIAAIERNGGSITTAYYDVHSLFCMLNPQKFFEKGVPIPRRMIPPQDAIEYYTDPEKRGYLADPDKISQERYTLSQKFGYTLPKIENDPDYEMLIQRKDPRQIFYGLQPGWVVSLRDKVILKSKAPHLESYYAN